MEDESIAATWSFLAPFAKKWSAKLCNEDIPEDDNPIVDELRSLNAEIAGVKLFVLASDDEIIPFDLERVVHFCHNIRVQDFDEQSKGSIWLDDRTHDSDAPISPPLGLPISMSKDDGSVSPLLVSFDSQEMGAGYGSLESEHNPVPLEIRAEGSTSKRYIPARRLYPVPLTAKMLYASLMEKRFNHVTLPNSDRRLVAIANPDSYDFLALTETAPQHQHEALRDAIAKYLSFRTSLKAKLSTRGIQIFQLEFHLPHFALRKGRPSRKVHSAKPDRDAIDLSFMSRMSSNSNDDGILSLYPAQISVTMCGTSEICYIGYCFEDNDFGEDREWDASDFSADGFHADQIAKGDIDANRPIWNPREYFLTALVERMKQVLKEWTRTVRTIESKFGDLCDSTITRDTSAASESTRKMLQLLRKLLPVIGATSDAWDCFISPNGDIGYFSDLTSSPSASKMKQMIHEINEAVEEMKGLQKILLWLQEQWEKEQRDLEVSLVMANNRITELTILWICPMTVISSFFAIPAPFIPFERNGLTFTVGLVLITALVRLLHFFVGGGLHRLQWYNQISKRMVAASQGDKTNTTKNAAGNRVIQRRRTHSWFKRTK